MPTLDTTKIIRVVTSKDEAQKCHDILHELHVPHKTFCKRRKNDMWMWAITSDTIRLRSDDLGTINHILDKALGKTPEAFLMSGDE